MGQANVVLHNVRTLRPLLLSCDLIQTDARHTKLIISQSRLLTHVLPERKQGGSILLSSGSAITNANPIKPYFLKSRPFTHPPLPKRKEYTTRSVRMENNREEMTSKRARETDSNLSPPAKKLHNTTSISSVATDGCKTPLPETNLNPNDSHNTTFESEKTETLLPKEIKTEAEQGNLDSQTSSNQAQDTNIKTISNQAQESNTSSHNISFGNEKTETLPKEIKMEAEQGNLDSQTTSNQAQDTNIKTISNQAQETNTSSHNISFGSEKTETLSPTEITTEPEQGNLDSQTTSNQAQETTTTNHNISFGNEKTETLPKEIKMEAEQGNLDSQTTSNQARETNARPEIRETTPHSSPTTADQDLDSKLTTTGTGYTRSPKHKGWKNHQEKWENKKDQGRKYGSGERRSPRPNYFVGVQISNPEIHRAILKVQEDLVANDESLGRALVDVATSHITLLVAHLGTQKDIDVAIGALEESAARIKDEVTANPIHLTFSGVKNFSHQVVFADVCKDIHHKRLLAMAECIRGVFKEHEVCMPDTRDLRPHLTIAKLSKAPTTKGKRAVYRKIDPSYYSQHLELHFGTQTLSGIQLLSMNKAKDESRYYHSDKQLIFDVKIEEDKDHSLCCFPRRPILALPQRTYTTSATTSSSSRGERDPPSPWFLSVAGVTTLVAGALVLGFVIARLRR